MANTMTGNLLTVAYDFFFVFICRWAQDLWKWLYIAHLNSESVHLFMYWYDECTSNTVNSMEYLYAKHNKQPSRMPMRISFHHTAQYWLTLARSLVPFETTKPFIYLFVNFKYRFLLFFVFSALRNRRRPTDPRAHTHTHTPERCAAWHGHTYILVERTYSISILPLLRRSCSFLFNFHSSFDSIDDERNISDYRIIDL